MQHERRWCKTTERILEVIKSKGEIDTNSLAKMTGYKITTVNAQVSILRRLGLITSHIREDIESICPPHIWMEETISKPYGDTITIRKCKVCGLTERM
ncbi:MAG: winged helix-turn-helix transcriptional regulator [Nitrososphaerales archaeon]